MTKYEIAVMIDDSAPLEERREQARIAASTFYDQITGDDDRRMTLYRQGAEVLNDAERLKPLMAELRDARLCPGE